MAFFVREPGENREGVFRWLNPDALNLMQLLFSRRRDWAAGVRLRDSLPSNGVGASKEDARTIHIDLSSRLVLFVMDVAAVDRSVSRIDSSRSILGSIFSDSHFMSYCREASSF